MSKTIKAADLSKGDIFLSPNGLTLTVTRVGRSRDRSISYVYVAEDSYPKRYPAGMGVTVVTPNREASMADHPSAGNK